MANNTQFKTNTNRYDPYKNFKFKVKFVEGGVPSDRYVAGISKISGLKRKTEVVTHREGGDPSTSRKSPGRTEYEAITLERGVTHDSDFEDWANQIWTLGSGAETEVSLKDFRRNLLIEVFNESGQLALSYEIHNCWVSEYQALPDLDANANVVAIQSIKVENEGWVRQDDVDEPQEVSTAKA